MGTSYHITVVGDVLSMSEPKLREKIEAELSLVNAAMSTYQEDSELSRFNKESSGQWHKVSSAMFTVMTEATAIFQLSSGKFDVTIAPLVNLWGFGPDFQEDRVPERAAIDAARERVGLGHIQLDRQKGIYKSRSDVVIDLSAIAKGYGVDRIAEMLEGLGIGNYMVEIGGDLRTAGNNVKGKTWRIAVERPHIGQRAVHRILAISNMAVATSGDYRNFFQWQGKRYSHVIDPLTGWPVADELVSVTVLSPDAMRADGLATAFLVMGIDKAYPWAEANAIPALFVLRKGDSFVDKSTQTMNNYMADK